MSRLDEFLIILDRVEGGYSNDSRDRGGETFRGITQKTYNNFCMKMGIPIKPVSSLSDEEVRYFYHEEIFKNCRFNERLEIHYNYFDSLVNGGSFGHKKITEYMNAKILERPMTELEILETLYDFRLRQFKKIAEIYYKTTSINEYPLKGWINRISKIRAYFNNRKRMANGK